MTKTETARLAFRSAKRSYNLTLASLGLASGARLAALMAEARKDAKALSEARNALRAAKIAETAC